MAVNESVVKILLEAGADPNLENKHKKKPVELAKPNVARVMAQWL